MNLDKCTFGGTPAAMYLALYLNENGDQALARKASRVLRNTRELLNDIVAAHLLTTEMKTRSFSSLIEMVQRSVDERAALIPDHHVGDLVKNILRGEIRILKARATKARLVQTKIQRGTPVGQSVPLVKATQFIGEQTQEERIAALQEKSRKYLLRKGKINTLY